MRHNHKVGVVIPALNAAEVIDRCLDAVLHQDVAIDFDVVVAVGPSHDDTAARVDARSAADSRVCRVDNPSGTTPAALNRAIAVTSGDLVVRVDAQSELPDGYLARVLATSASSGAANVGGIQRAVGTEPWEGGWLSPLNAAIYPPRHAYQAKQQAEAEEEAALEDAAVAGALAPSPEPAAVPLERRNSRQ